MAGSSSFWSRPPVFVWRVTVQAPLHGLPIPSGTGLPLQRPSCYPPGTLLIGSSSMISEPPIPLTKKLNDSYSEYDMLTNKTIEAVMETKKNHATSIDL